MARKHRRSPQVRLAVRPISVRQTQLARLGNGHLEQRIRDWAASGARMGIECRYPLPVIARRLAARSDPLVPATSTLRGCAPTSKPKPGCPTTAGNPEKSRAP